jgi:hypothetical protein
MSAPLFGPFRLRGRFFGGAYVFSFDRTDWTQYFVAGPFSDDFIASVTGIACGVAFAPTGGQLATYDYSPFATIVGPAIMRPHIRPKSHAGLNGYGYICGFDWLLQSSLSPETILKFQALWLGNTP